MKEYEIYNSRNKLYKSPFGAVSAGTPVSLTVCLPITYSFATVTLIIYKGTVSQEITLSYQETKDNTLFYHCSFVPSNKGVYFYLFRVQSNKGTEYIKKADDGSGYLAQNGPDFQLTVFHPNYKTPDWCKGGIIYQIFPDRFCYSGQHHDNVPEDRILRSDWGGMPYFLPNERGEILNDDYFCGDLKGIEQKLPYLKRLGVTLIYLNPIFEAHSSHRYNTADYLKIDPLLGTEEDFTHLCRAAKEMGIRIILDGVFSHTGSDSIYFNKNNRYDSVGAYNSPESPYKSWYHFNQYPNEYHSWWGFDTLPTLNKNEPSYIEFICGENGVIRKWLRAGASGFRLDVADELPDEFIVRIREAVKAEGEDNLLLGEVWEDASNKISYGVHRRYFLGYELDTVMNYPFKDAILHFLVHGDKPEFINRIMTIVENYPPQSLHVAMNSLSTHDTERALTILGGMSSAGTDRLWQSHHQLTMAQFEVGLSRLKIAMVLQYFLPGVPCIYYGDEAGLQGYKDPFNRCCFPWGHERMDLVEHAKLLGELRNQSPAMKEGTLRFLHSCNGTLAFERKDKDGSTIIVINYTNSPQSFQHDWRNYQCLYGHTRASVIHLPPYDFAVYSIRK